MLETVRHCQWIPWLQHSGHANMCIVSLWKCCKVWILPVAGRLPMPLLCPLPWSFLIVPNWIPDPNSQSCVLLLICFLCNRSSFVTSPLPNLNVLPWSPANLHFHFCVHQHGGQKGHFTSWKDKCLNYHTLKLYNSKCIILQTQTHLNNQVKDFTFILLIVFALSTKQVVAFFNKWNGSVIANDQAEPCQYLKYSTDWNFKI